MGKLTLPIKRDNDCSGNWYFCYNKKKDGNEIVKNLNTENTEKEKQAA